MAKTDRAELIRAIHRAKAGLFAYVPSGKLKRPDNSPTGGHWRVNFGAGESFRWGRTDWLEKPDAIPDSVTPQIKRTARKTALTRIANRWDERKQLAAPMLRR